MYYSIIIYCNHIALISLEKPKHQAVWLALGLPSLGWWCVTILLITSRLIILQVGGGSTSPYNHPELTAKYITKWVNGSKQVYNLDIDYVGVSHVNIACTDCLSNTLLDMERKKL